MKLLNVQCTKHTSNDLYHTKHTSMTNVTLRDSIKHTFDPFLHDTKHTSIEFLHDVKKKITVMPMWSFNPIKNNTIVHDRP